MNEIAIRLEGVGKAYDIYARPSDRIKEMFHPLRRPLHRKFQALEGIDLEVRRGEAYGIVGRNGSGKSTLLQIIAGVLAPSTGRVEARGRLASLLELGVGFDVECTGLENIRTFCAINGLSPDETEARIERIVRFSELEAFIQQPVKRYSSGMFMRLAFACATHIDPDIFIVDEALAVGDMNFVQKCFRWMRDFVADGGTLLFVSHDMGSVRSIAARALWIDQGRVREQGNARDVTDHYAAFMLYGDARQSVVAAPSPTAIAGTEDAFAPVPDNKYTVRNGARCALRFGRAGAEAGLARPFDGNELVEYALRVEFEADVARPMLGVAIVNAKAVTVCHYNTEIYGRRLPPIRAGETRVFRLRFRLPNLARGFYNFYTNLVDGEYAGNESLCMLNGVCEFEVLPPADLGKLTGLVYLENPDIVVEAVQP